MKPRKKCSFVYFILCFCLLCFGTALAQQKPKKSVTREESSNKEKELGGKKLQMKDLPPAVQKALKEQTMGATIVSISTEKEGGKIVYEVETKVDGHARDMLIDSTGKVIEIEEEVDMASLPAAVQAEAKKSLGQGKVDRIESVTKNGIFSGYEAVVERGSKKVEVSLGPDGKVLPVMPKK